jgi:cell division protein FtsB
MIQSAKRKIPMPQRLSIGATIYLVVVCGLGLYFAFAAVQGPSGILRRVQIEAETADLEMQRDNLRTEVEEIENLTHRLSDDYLDLDLLDERAREVLGMLRSDEIILR